MTYLYNKNNNQTTTKERNFIINLLFFSFFIKNFYTKMMKIVNMYKHTHTYDLFLLYYKNNLSNMYVCRRINVKFYRLLSYLFAFLLYRRHHHVCVSSLSYFNNNNNNDDMKASMMSCKR